MDEVLTLAQIEARYVGEWILLEDPELDANLVVQRGRVLCHSKDRDEVYAKARELRPRHSAFLYTGTIPADSAVVL